MARLPKGSRKDVLLLLVLCLTALGLVIVLVLFGVSRLL